MGRHKILVNLGGLFVFNSQISFFLFNEGFGLVSFMIPLLLKNVTNPFIFLMHWQVKCQWGQEQIKTNTKCQYNNSLHYQGSETDFLSLLSMEDTVLIGYHSTVAIAVNRQKCPQAHSRCPHVGLSNLHNFNISKNKNLKIDIETSYSICLRPLHPKSTGQAQKPCPSCLKVSREII